MKKRLNGTIVSDKVEGVRVVKVTRLWQHPLYKKRVRRSKRYHAFDPLKAKLGDLVLIEERKPMSKTKKWEIIKILKKEN